MKELRYIFLTIILVTSALNAYSQQINESLNNAKNFHNNYEFDKAIKIYNHFLYNNLDSLHILRKDSVKKCLIQSENGKNLLKFSAFPKLVKKETFSINDFFLKYPKNFEWIQTPKSLIEFATNSLKYANVSNIDSSSKILIDNRFAYMQYSSGRKKIVFSAPNKNGLMSIFSAEKINDTLWSAPEILGPNINTNGNEVFPYLSADNKRLYFSSNGHYGMGGYDLYVSEWDQKNNNWSTPQNLGFPFSSVADDFLYYDTPDKLISLFASTRETKNEEITIYAVKYESSPIKEEIAQKDAYQFSLLNTENKQSSNNQEREISSDQDIYYQSLRKLKDLQKELDKKTAVLSAKRTEYSNATSERKKSLESEILEQEKGILAMQQEINNTSNQLQEIEMKFLSQGVILTNEINKEFSNTDTSIDFNFENNSLKDSPIFKTANPKPLVNLDLQFLKEAYIADISLFPNNLTYQIQLLSLSNKANLKLLKGASPVFERKNANGRYIYSVGVFNSHKEALANLSKVKQKGFPKAIITAYKDGEQITLQAAKKLETPLESGQLYNITIINPDNLPKKVLDIIKANTNKDIAKSTKDGISKYIIGPFTSKAEAEKLYNQLIEAKIKFVEMENIEKTK